MNKMGPRLEVGALKESATAARLLQNAESVCGEAGWRHRPLSLSPSFSLAPPPCWCRLGEKAPHCGGVGVPTPSRSPPVESVRPPRQGGGKWLDPLSGNGVVPTFTGAPLDSCSGSVAAVGPPVRGVPNPSSTSWRLTGFGERRPPTFFCCCCFCFSFLLVGSV